MEEKVWCFFKHQQKQNQEVSGVATQSFLD